MARSLTWRQLTPGVVIFVVLVVLVGGVLTFARIGKLHGDTQPLYMVTNTASGVMNGTEVWLNGQPIGVVDAVKFRSVSADTTERLVIEMTILTQYMEHIRKDSDVQLRPGTSLIGSPVVYILGGTNTAPVIRAGDTLRARAQIEGRSTRTADFTSLGDSLVAAGTTVQQLTQHVHETGRDVDRLRARAQRQLEAMGHAFSKYSSRATSSKGSLSRMMYDTTLHNAVHRATAQADSIRQLLNSPQHSLGRFRRDSTIFAAASGVLANMDTLRTRLTTATVVERPDSALVRELHRTRLQLDSLVTDAQRHPLRYLSL